MKRTSLALLVSTLGMGAAAGCDPVANDDYQGKVLATLHGQVATAQAGPSLFPIPPVEVALIWGRPDGMATKFVAEKVPIAGAFPAEFSVDLHHPPPSSSGGMVGGVKLNQAFIAALVKTDWKQGTLLEKGRRVEAYGLASELLLHLDRSVAADAPLAVLMGGVHDAGFHMMGFAEITAAQAQARAAACLKVLASDQASRCDAKPVDGRYQGMVEVEGGLAHVIKLQLSSSSEERIEIVGGEAEDVPCPDCEDPVSSGGTPAPRGDGGAGDPDAGCGSNSSMGSTASGAGCPPPGTGGSTGGDNDPAAPGGKP